LGLQRDSGYGIEWDDVLRAGTARGFRGAGFAPL
jgi:hypothetical protein